MAPLFSFDPLLDFLYSWVVTLIRAVRFVFSFIVAIANYLLRLVYFLGGLVGVVFDYLRRQARALKGFIRHLWKGGFSHLLTDIWGVVKKLKSILVRIFGPIICIVEAVIAYEEALFNLYIRPILIMLQHLRSVLVLFRLLHVKWAGALDQKIRQLEQRIFDSFGVVLRELNDIRQTISLFLNPFGLFNPVVLFTSMLTTIGDLWRALHALSASPLGASELDSIKRDTGIFHTRPAGVGIDKPYYDELAAGFNRELRSVIGKR